MHVPTTYCGSLCYLNPVPYCVDYPRGLDFSFSFSALSFFISSNVSTIYILLPTRVLIHGLILERIEVCEIDDKRREGYLFQLFKGPNYLFLNKNDIFPAGLLISQLRTKKY